MIDLRLLGSRLKQRRELQHITQEKLAELADTSIEHISRIENGHASVSLDMLDRLCCALDLDIGSLFSGLSVTSDTYQSSEVSDLFSKLDPKLKIIVLDFIKKLTDL